MTFEIGDSSLRMTDMGTKTDSKMLLKLGSKTGVNIDSGIWTGAQIWESKLHSCLSSISLKGKLANLSMGHSKEWNLSSSICWS